MFRNTLYSQYNHLEHSEYISIQYNNSTFVFNSLKGLLILHLKGDSDTYLRTTRCLFTSCRHHIFISECITASSDRYLDEYLMHTYTWVLSDTLNDDVNPK